VSKELSLVNGRTVSLDPWCLMGILNTTPDSFSDGGRHLDPAFAIAAGLEMVADGATILDVGGESTRPGAKRVSAQDQIKRVLPVIEGLREVCEAAISIDTTLAFVAEAAIDAGADLVNDVSAGREDPTILDLVAEKGCGIVLMHRLCPPGEDSWSDRYTSAPQYEDVVANVSEFLAERAAVAQDRGIGSQKIVLDPGLGFGKTVEQNLELVVRIEEIVNLGYPVLLGASRKSFLGALSGVEEPVERGAASLAIALRAWQGGASILRVHEPKPHREALGVAQALRCHEQNHPATISSSRSV